MSDIFILATGCFAAVIFALIRILRIFPGLKSRPVCGKRHIFRYQGRRISSYAQGSGLRIAMLASVGRSVSDFNELSSALVEAGFRTLTVEAPGCGGTDSIPDGSSLDDLANDFMAAIAEDQRQVGGGVTIGLGHGFGHRVVRSAAQRDSAVISACILIAPGYRHSLTGEDAKHFRQCFNPLLRKSVRLEHLHKIFFSAESSVPTHWHCGWHWRTAKIQGSASAATPGDDWRSSGEVPVLLIQGVDDHVAPHKEVVANLRQEVGAKRLKLAMVQKAGHALLPEQPISVARIVTDFLNQGFFSRKRQQMALRKGESPLNAP